MSLRASVKGERSRGSTGVPYGSERQREQYDRKAPEGESEKGSGIKELRTIEKQKKKNLKELGVF